MPLSSPVASIVAPWPLSVSAFETATSSLYVPAHTTMVSPGAAALTAALMVPNDAVVHDVPAAPAAPVGETYHVVLAAATPEALTSDAPSSSTDPPSEPANRNIRSSLMRFPQWRFPPHPEGSDSPLAQRDGLATVWDAALVELP
jgi:hypothetical protein